MEQARDHLHEPRIPVMEGGGGRVRGRGYCWRFTLILSLSLSILHKKMTLSINIDPEMWISPTKAIYICSSVII